MWAKRGLGTLVLVAAISTLSQLAPSRAENVGAWQITTTPAEYGRTTTTASVEGHPLSEWDPKTLVVSCQEGLLPSDYLISNGAAWTTRDRMPAAVELQIDNNSLHTEIWRLGGYHVIFPSQYQTEFLSLIQSGTVLHVTVHSADGFHTGAASFTLLGIKEVLRRINAACGVGGAASP